VSVKDDHRAALDCFMKVLSAVQVADHGQEWKMIGNRSGGPVSSDEHRPRPGCSRDFFDRGGCADDHHTGCCSAHGGQPLKVNLTGLRRPM
jgi:hypothetical protein